MIFTTQGSHRWLQIVLFFSLTLMLFGCSKSQDIGANILEPRSALADLLIVEAKLLPSTAEVGKVELTLILENKGNAGVKDAFSILGNWVENPSMVSRVLFTSTAQLEPGARQTIRQHLSLGSLIGKSGNYILSVDVCPESACMNRIHESEENNNILITPFSL